MRLIFVTAMLLAACATPVAPSPPSVGAPFAGDITAFVAADRASPPAPCQVLFVGSSSIRFWTTLADDMAPRPVIRRGFGGSTIGDVNLYFNDIVAPYRPRAIVFYAGENDIDLGATPEGTVEAFRQFMAMKRRVLGATPVYFISLKPSRLRAGQLAHQREVNAAVEAMARRRRDLEYIDVASAMMQNGVPRDIFVEDGLHMSAAGYEIWTRIVRDALAAPPPTRAPGCD
jgi:lysophospholipase L1-like esterase